MMTLMLPSAATRPQLEELQSTIAQLQKEKEELQKLTTQQTLAIAQVQKENEELQKKNKELHDRAEEKDEELVAVKEDANRRAAAAEAHLEVVRQEKNDVEASLREVEAELEDANELTNQQTLATDIWQGRFDEVSELAREAGADANRLLGIRNRPLSSGS